MIYQILELFCANKIKILFAKLFNWNCDFYIGEFSFRFNKKTSEAPAQMTIFYGGTVSVFEDISPEKVSLSPTPPQVNLFVFKK